MKTTGIDLVVPLERLTNVLNKNGCERTMPRFWRSKALCRGTKYLKFTAFFISFRSKRSATAIQYC